MKTLKTKSRMKGSMSAEFPFLLITIALLGTGAILLGSAVSQEIANAATSYSDDVAGVQVDTSTTLGP